MKSPEWLNTTIEIALGIALLLLCLVPIALVVIAILFPGSFLIERPGLGCAIFWEDNKFIAPSTNWVRFTLSCNPIEEDLPRVSREDIPSLDLSYRVVRIDWDKEKTHQTCTIEHDLPPGEWLEIKGVKPQSLTVQNINKRTMALETRDSVKLRASWVCAAPLLTIAFLVEVFGIMLALLDFTGQVARLEAFLDKLRVALYSWLFPWKSSKSSDESVGVGPPLFARVLTLLIMLISYFKFGISAWWHVIPLFICSLLLAIILDFVIKWSIGCLIWGLWVLLDKAPTGTVGGIGFLLVLYGIGSNYIWG